MKLVCVPVGVHDDEPIAHPHVEPIGSIPVRVVVGPPVLAIEPGPNGELLGASADVAGDVLAVVVLVAPSLDTRPHLAPTNVHATIVCVCVSVGYLELPVMPLVPPSPFRSTYIEV
jgi:hypothetical protein